MTMTNEVLSIEEQNAFERCEVVIKQGLETFIEVGQALMEIRDNRYYRLEYRTFEDYCRGKWNFARQTAYQYISAANVIDNVRHGGQDVLPASERQARPLTKLEPEIQQQAWAEVVDRHKEAPEQITAKEVEQVANEWKPYSDELKQAKQDNQPSVFNPEPKPVESLVEEVVKKRKDTAYKERYEKEAEQASPMHPVRVCAYGDGMYRKSSTRSEDRYGDKVFSLSDDKYNTVSTLSRFYHRETMLEFTLREYAQVQTFPDNYNFVGTYSTIKKQIGNAVAPFMGKYITEPLKGKTIGDLFAGAGGFSCGAHQNDKVTKWAVEWEEDAATTFKFNNPDTEVYNANIKDIDPSKLEKVDIIIGGPPCQGFSSANHENKKVSGAERFIDDSRNLLYKEFVRFVNVLQPAEFVMENVQEIYEVKDEIIADFEQLGYSVHVTLVAGNDIGMKQNRKRCFFIGNKNA